MNSIFDNPDLPKRRGRFRISSGIWGKESHEIFGLVFSQVLPFVTVIEGDQVVIDALSPAFDIHDNDDPDTWPTYLIIFTQTQDAYGRRSVDLKFERE